MSLIQFLVGLAVVGVVLWAVNAFIPMNSSIKKIINFIVVVAVALYCLRYFGVIRGGPRLFIVG
jgi:hypothetical protein